MRELHQAHRRTSNSRFRYLTLILGLLLGGKSVAMAQARQMMDDPLFGIPYNPQVVHFEDAPKIIGELCPDLRNRKLWVYAQWGMKDTQYFIVSGFIKTHSDSPSSQEGSEPAFGTAVFLHRGKCTEDQSEYFLRREINPARGATPIAASNTVLVEIARNALQRYARAFGSKAIFLKQLSPSDRKALPPVLKEELERFERKSAALPGSP